MSSFLPFCSFLNRNLAKRAKNKEKEISASIMSGQNQKLSLKYKTDIPLPLAFETIYFWSSLRSWSINFKSLGLYQQDIFETFVSIIVLCLLQMKSLLHCLTSLLWALLKAPICRFHLPDVFDLQNVLNNLSKPDREICKSKDVTFTSHWLLYKIRHKQSSDTLSNGQNKRNLKEIIWEVDLSARSKPIPICVIEYFPLKNFKF